MKSVIVVLFAVLTLLPTQTRANNESEAKKRYSQIFSAYRPVSGGLRGAKTDGERRQAVEQLSVYSSKFNSVAAEYPEDPIALTALRQAVQVVGSTDSAALQTWEMNRADFPPGSSDGSAARTVELVLQHHLLSKGLAPIVDRMRYQYRLDYGKCLETVLERNPHHDIQGLTCLALAQYLHDKLRMIHLVRERPKLAECYAIVFGKDYLPALKQLGESGLSQRIELLFERATEQYADVKFRSSTVGAAAKSELYEIRHLGIGRTAPDIKGQDQNGTPFALSDYRGKVVLLYFWSEY